jgi:NAD(P)-dependent dehydrogenase (short-subunit alcohol dehydrogenase family)
LRRWRIGRQTSAIRAERRRATSRAVSVCLCTPKQLYVFIVDRDSRAPTFPPRAITVQGGAAKDLGLAGRKALVTGGTKGIGRSIAEHLAHEGAHVAICARNAADVAETVASLKQRGVNASGRAVDITDAEGLKSWVRDAAEELGGLDIVIPNVSALAISNDDAGWRAGFETDMMGTVHTVDAAMQFLERSDAASIVIISSVSGREIDFAAGPYGAFKAALIHYARVLRSISRRRAFAPTPSRPATRISRAVCGKRSNMGCRNCMQRRWR